MLHLRDLKQNNLCKVVHMGGKWQLTSACNRAYLSLLLDTTSSALPLAQSRWMDSVGTMTQVHSYSLSQCQ